MGLKPPPSQHQRILVSLISTQSWPSRSAVGSQQTRSCGVTICRRLDLGDVMVMFRPARETTSNNSLSMKYGRCSCSSTHDEAMLAVEEKTASR